MCRYHLSDAVENLVSPSLLGERLLHPPPLGHIVGNLGGAHDIAGEVAHRRDGQGNVEPMARLVDADRLEALDALAAADPGEDFALLLLDLRRYEAGDRLPDHFRGGIAEQALSALVPGCDDALEGLADDHVFGGVDDRRQMGTRALQLGEIGRGCGCRARAASFGIIVRCHPTDSN